MNVAQIPLRSIRRRPRQALLTGVSIVIATAFAAAALLIALNAQAALAALGMSTPAAADAVVTLQGDVGWERAAGIAENLDNVTGVHDVVIEYIGDVEVEANGVTSTWRFTSDPGTGPFSAIDELSSAPSLESGQVVIGTNTAERTGVEAGDSLIAEGREFSVVGTESVEEIGQDAAYISEGDAASLGAVMSPERIFITGNASLDELRSASEGSVVVSGDELRDQEARDVTDTSVGVFGALAVFVGLAAISAIVIVSSTFRILLARRTGELAMLRSIGAGQSQVRRLVLFEAASIGLLGGVLGTALGLGLSYALVGVARGAGLVAEPFITSPIGLIACLAAAVVFTMVASLPAARAAGSTAPVTALGAARSSEARQVRTGPRLISASALALSAVAAAAAGIQVSDTQEILALGLAALSGILMFAVLIVVGPLLIQGAELALRPLSARSTALRLAASNARRASRRTASMTTVLTLGVGLTAALMVAVAGVSEDSQELIESNYPAEAMIPVDFVSEPDQVVDELSAHPDVDAHIEGLDILIDPAPGSDLAALRAAVHESTEPGTFILWTADVREGMEQMILVGQVVGATLIGVTVLVALIGMMVTLGLSVSERRREIALLRALGVSRAGARRAVAAEATLAALISAIIGVSLGIGYGLLALHVLGMSVSVPSFGAPAILVAGVIVAAVLAAVAPMRSAGRVQPAIGLAAR